jgi:Basic region leucine zipper
LNDPDDHQFSFIHEVQTFGPIDFLTACSTVFGLDAECQFDTSFDIACTSSNSTSLGSQSTRPASTTFSQIPEPLSADGYDLSNSWPLTERGYALGSVSHDNAGTCDIGNRHRAEWTTGYNLSLPTDVLTQVHGQSTLALANQDQHGAPTTTPDYREQAQHTSRSSALIPPSRGVQDQSAISGYDNQLRVIHYQPTDGNVAQSQPSKQSSTPNPSSGPRHSISKSDSLQAEVTDSKTPNPEITKLRRQRNSAAARKYRQRRLDRIEELEQALQKTQAERDDLKVQVARWRGKAEALQSLMAISGVDGPERHR